MLMINKRLIREVDSSMKYVGLSVLCQWGMLVLNIVLIAAIAKLLEDVILQRDIFGAQAGAAALLAVVVIWGRWLLCRLSARFSDKASREVKQKLRTRIYRKLLELGSSYRERVSTSEVVQVSVEGVDQLETYFSSYLPQFFYAMIAPLTLFAVTCVLNWKAALVLLICVPLIPVAIAAVQTFAKKLLSRYWGQYTSLGDHFLENLQGLTTLKIYQADEARQEVMREEAEKFRRITMKVLTMQLNSITIMDLVAFGGAALGIAVALIELQHQALSIAGCLMFILLAAEFFIPMRTLGSYFHIAMNGMAASDKIFRLIDMERPPKGTRSCSDPFPIVMEDVRFSYDGEKQVISSLDLRLAQGSFTAIVGESGCGKSTTARLLMGAVDRYQGKISMNGIDLRDIREEDVHRMIVGVSHAAYLFAGTVRDQLRMARADATDEEMWTVLEKVKLAGFLREEQGLDTMLSEQGSNFSGGQRQRLAIARALLHDAKVYIFDEATSNIDVESENDIMRLIEQLAETKTVVLITHRLANVVRADRILVMEDGRITESGTHAELLQEKGTFTRLWHAQQELENYGKEDTHAE